MRFAHIQTADSGKDGKRHMENNEGKLTHFDGKGNAWMVNVGEKDETHRTAIAHGKIYVNSEVFRIIAEGGGKKGDVLTVAQIAGIMGAKKTSELIPLCHNILLTKCSIHFDLQEEERAVEVFCTVETRGQTGVEMEALTGVNIALLTIYDMCKALDRGMTMSDICLLKKEGGKSGVYERQTGTND